MDAKRQRLHSHGDHVNENHLILRIMNRQNLRALVTMGKENTYDQHISFDPRIVREDALLNLGVCLVREAKLKEAEACFTELIEKELRVNEALANLKVINRLKARYHQKSKKKRVKRNRR
jgi:hypothetical protein